MPVNIGIIIPVNVDKLKRAEIDAIGTKCPGSVEKLRVENLQSEGHPAARRAAVQEAGMTLPDAAKVLLDIGNELASDSRAVRSVVGRVNLVRVAERTGTIQVDEDEGRRVAIH